jgi:hypothetical protein
MGIRNFNLRSSQVRKWREIGLNQPLIYIHRFPSLSSQFFYLSLLKSIAKKLFLGRKNSGRIPAPFPNTVFSTAIHKTLKL